MAKLTLNDIDSLANTASAKQALNNNFTAIEAAVENTLSRDGATPNQMEADIDLNDNDLLNVKRIDATEIYKNGLPFEQEIAYANKLYDLFSGTGAQTDYMLQAPPGSLGNLDVAVAGDTQRPGLDYNVDGTTLSFVVAPPAGTDNILVRYDLALATQDSVLRQDLASTLADGGAELVAFKQSGAGAVARTMQDKGRDVVSVKDFGAVGDGVADDTIAVQRAIDSLGSSGGEVELGNATLRVTSALVINNPRVAVVGAGRRGSRIIQATPGARVFDIRNEYFTARDFSVEYVTQGASGGAAFHTNHFYGIWQNVYVKNAHIGWHFAAGSNSQQLINVVAEDSTQNGFLVSGDNVSVSNFFVINQRSSSFCTLGGLRMQDKAEGCVFSVGQLYGGAYAFTSDATSYTVGKRPAYSKFSCVYFDSAQSGVLINKAVELDFISCWFSNRPAGGFNITSSDGIRFNGGGAINNATHGGLVDTGSKNVSFLNFAVRGNSSATSNTSDGLVFASDVTDFSVISCTIGADSALGFGSQRNGISISTGCDRFNITGNNLNGNASAAMVDNSAASADKTVYGNKGYRTSNSGVALVASASSSVVVSHGLSAAPGQQDVQITPTADVPERWWVSAANATTFTISLSASTALDRFFSWSARIKGA